MARLRLPMFLLAHALLGWWPARAGYLVADAVGAAVWWLAWHSRGVVREHQRRALGPEADAARLRRSVAAVYRHTARNYFDLIHFSFMTGQEVDARLRVWGEEHLRAALAAGRGVIIATAHVGSPELAAQGLARRGVPVTALSEPLEPPALFRLITRWRQSHGVEFPPTGVTGLRQALRRLREGGVVIVACDRDIQGVGVSLPFLGALAQVPTGAATLALKTGAALLPAFCARSQGTTLEVYIEPPVELPREGPLEERALALTAALLQVAERYIRRFPEQWYVLDPIWLEGEGATTGAAVSRGALTSGAE